LLIGVIGVFFGLVGCEREVSFSKEVQPVLTASCISCHNENAEGYISSGFSLADYDAVMKGTNFGPVVIPGSSASSTLYLLVAHKTDPKIHMPPHTEDALAEGRGASLTVEQIELIKDWIDQGAQDN